MDAQIFYKKGYKYQLAQDYEAKTNVVPKNETITTEYITLLPDGTLRIKKGYAWDGPSGPTIDTKSFMRGSLEHDAFYQLLRMKKLSEDWFKTINQRLRDVCREDGMSRFRAWYVWRGVSKFTKFATKPKNAKKVIVAP